MNEPFPLEVLSDARRRGVDWMDVAQAFDALNAGPSSVPAGTTPIRWAEKVSGYTSNHLRRMSAGRQFYVELTQANPALANTLGRPRFSHCEMLAKIWRLDRKRVLELLQHQPKLSFAGLSGLFEALQNQTPSSKSSGKRVQAQFRELCIGALLKHPDPVLTMGVGVYTLIAPRVHRDPYCKPDFILKCVQASAEPTWSGIDCFVADKPGDGALGRKMVAVATESTFLTHCWLCVTDNDQTIGHIVDVADGLELSNLGILVLIGETLDVARIPSGPPVHDRRQLWQPPRLWNNIMDIRAL